MPFACWSGMTLIARTSRLEFDVTGHRKIAFVDVESGVPIGW